MAPFLAEHAGEPVGRARRLAGGEDRARGGARDGRRAAAARARTRSCSPAAAARATTSRSRARRGPRARATAALDGVVTTGIEHKAVLGACDRLRARGLPRRRSCRRPRPASSTSTRLAGSARRAHRGRVGDARQQRDRHRPAARRGRRARARARAAGGAAHRRGAGAAVARRRAAPRPTPISSRSRATSSAARRASARSSCATASSSCRWSRAAVTSGACAPARRTSPASSRSPPRCASPHANASRGDRARIAALRDRLEQGLLADDPGSRRQRRPGVAGRRDPARRVPRRRGRDAARRARPARRRARRRARRARSGAIDPSHVLLAMGIDAATRALVGAVQPRLRVDRRRRRRRARRRSRGRRAKLRARPDGDRGAGDDERRCRLVGRGRSCCRDRGVDTAAHHHHDARHQADPQLGDDLGNDRERGVDVGARSTRSRARTGPTTARGRAACPCEQDVRRIDRAGAARRARRRHDAVLVERDEQRLGLDVVERAVQDPRDPGARARRSPRSPAICSASPCSSASRSAAMRAVSSARRSCVTRSAVANATMPATFCVPGAQSPLVTAALDERNELRCRRAR